jgi:RNA polymerase sigma factor (sigma-70 family)
MNTTSGIPDTPHSFPAQFVTTHWSAVLTAAHPDSTHVGQALAELCETYWYPLYAYVRRRGYAPADAQDLTQEFFARLLAGNWLDQADRTRGRFRSFLLSAMKHFLANDWNKAGTQKRGGHIALVSLDADKAETQYGRHAVTEESPDRLFERRWAVALLDRVLGGLEEEYRREDKGGLFAALKPSLATDRNALSYPTLAASLGISEGAARVAVHRLRQRYREMLRAEVGHTVVSAGEVEEEMHYLFQVLAGQ